MSKRGEREEKRQKKDNKRQFDNMSVRKCLTCVNGDQHKFIIGQNVFYVHKIFLYESPIEYACSDIKENT